MSASPRKLDVGQRERAIIRYLRDLEEPERGASVPQMHRALTEDGVPIGTNGEVLLDTVTPPVYYKLVRRMVATGQLEAGEQTEADGQLYRLAEHLHVDTALTLDDIRDLLAERRPTEAIAAMIDAREYLWDHRTTVLRDAAMALQSVDPRVLVFEMITSKIEAYDADVDLWRAGEGDDDAHLLRMKHARAELDRICYRWFGLSHEAVHVPAGGEPEEIWLDPGVLRDQLARRIYGDRAISLVQPDASAGVAVDWENAVTAGSDGSTYSSIMQIDTASRYTDDSGSEVVTFNNSLVYLAMEGDNRRRHPHPYYSVPLTRSAIDSPHNTGMVMARFMYRDELTDSDYEHMAKCATDVVQWRADNEVFRGNARSIGDGTALPAPTVHLRDGTVTLQERESHHYQRVDPYGDMVREGVRLSHDILMMMRDKTAPPVFAGSVKSTQINLFAAIVNWFIQRGCPASGIRPIDPGWQAARGERLADNEAMTLLLSSIADQRSGGYHVTFVVVRPFHALTDLWRRQEKEAPGVWVSHFERHKMNQLQDRLEDSYWRTVPTVADDPYVRMCERADYALFYIGHTEGEPPPLLPRYEFIESLRSAEPEVARHRVERNVALIVGALHRTHFWPDADHNFLSSKRLRRIVPRVIYEAHERCKALGRQLERELRSMVIAQLQQLRRATGRVATDVRFRPLGLRTYIDMLEDARRIRELSAGDDSARAEGVSDAPDDPMLDR